MINTFFTFDAGDIASTTEHISNLFGDLKPIILLIVGVGVVMMAVGSIIKSIKA